MKLKILAVVGFIGFFIVGGLSIWGGISAVRNMASTTKAVMASRGTQEQIEALKIEAQELTRFQALSCWSKAQSLLAVQPWLEKPALVNLTNLKTACLEPKPQVCKENDCEQMKDQFNSDQGGFI